MSTEHDDVFSDETVGGPPADWKPDWARWKQMQARGRELARRLGELTPKLADLERQLAAARAAEESAKASGAAEFDKLRSRLEDTELRTVEGLAEPDPAVFRAQHRAAMADVPEAQRQSLVDWAKAQAKSAVEKPAEAPRWMRGFLGEAPKPGGPKPPPSDPSRRPAPPPKGGYTPEQIESMSPAEYKAHESAIVAQLNGGT